MTDRNSPVTEDELHAYVDGELPADRKEAVAAWLAAHPEQAAQVAAWQAQAEAIRARYGAVAQEPVPARLKLEQVMRKRSRRRPLVDGDGGGGGDRRLRARRRRRLDGARRFDRGARAASTPITADAHRSPQALRGRSPPPGRSAGQRARPHDAMADRSGSATSSAFPICNRSVSSWSAAGCCRDRPAKRPRSICMKARPASASRSIAPRPPRKRRKPRCASRTANRFAAIYWVDDKRAYVVSGPADRDRLETITKMVYDQVDKSGPKKS